MTIHSSILAWRIPWTKEAGRLQPIASHKLTLRKQLNMHAYLNKAGVGVSAEKKKAQSKSWVVVKSCSCAQLFFDPINCSPTGFSVHGISQATILEWVAISFSRKSSWPRDWIRVSWISMEILYHWAPGEAHVESYVKCLLIKKIRYPKLRNFMLFYVREDPRVWAHWNLSFAMHLSYLGLVLHPKFPQGSPVLQRRSQLWLHVGSRFFDLLFIAAVIIIMHNGLPHRTLPLCLNVKLKCLCSAHREIIWLCPH